VTASALASSIPDLGTFRSGRHFAAWLGLVPKQNSSGGKTRLGRISKQGNKYLRQLLILGATSVLRYLRREGSQPSPWIAGLLRRRPPKVVAVALANNMARIAWSVMTRGGEYEDKLVLSGSLMPVRWLAHEVEAWEVSEGSRWSTAKDQPNPVSVSGVTARLNDRGLGPAKPFKASSEQTA
jgi:hypothetical protein